MTSFEYTHDWDNDGVDFESSSVNTVYYNANDRYAVIDWDSRLYRYDNVSLEEVEAVVSAHSVGNAANYFKQLHGPGTYLGSFWEVVSVGIDEKVASQDGDVATATKEYSLQTPPEPTPDPLVNTTSTVHFTLDGYDKVYTFASNKEEVDTAIGEVNDYVSRLGAKGKAVKVVFEFA